MESEADDESAKFRVKLSELRSVWSPIELRRSELHALPAAIESAREAIEQMRNVSETLQKRAYLSDDAAKFATMIDEYEAWLSEKEAEQAQLAATEEPVLLSTTVGDRMKPVIKFGSELLRRRPPKPAATTTTKKDKSSTEDEATSADGESTEAPADETTTTETEPASESTEQTEQQPEQPTEATEEENPTTEEPSEQAEDGKDEL